MLEALASLHHMIKFGERGCFQFGLLGSADAVAVKVEQPQIAKPWQRCGQRRSSSIPNAVFVKVELLQLVEAWERLGQRHGSIIPNAVF